MPPETAELEDALRHERSLRRLAATLCASTADADDAVQHAVSQVALGRRPREVPLLAFLRTTLRNHAFNLRKLASRRRRREAAVAEQAGVARPVDELVARDQLRRKVASAVLALDEPYRTTVWLRWFEDFTVGAIGRRMQVPSNTVRTRLQRAHARLRERLDRDYGDRQWIALAAPAAPASSTAAGTAVLVGGALVVKKTLLAIACLVAIGGSALWIPSWRGVETLPETRREARLAVAAPPQGVARVRMPAVEDHAGSPPATSPKPMPAPAKDPTEQELAAFAADVQPDCVEGVVLRGLVPIDGGRAWLRGMQVGGLPWGAPDGWDAAPDVHRASIDHGGMFRFEGLEPDTYAVGVQARDGARRHVYFDVPGRGEGTRRIRIVLGTATVRGRVFDPQGLSAPSWHVALYNHGRMPAGTQVILGTTADTRGEFEFSGLCGGTWRLQAAPGTNFSLAPALTLQLAAGEERSVLLGSPPTACDWRGRVLLPRGQAVGVQMLVELELDTDGTVTHHRLGEQGDFEARVLAGTYRAMLRFATGTRIDLGTVEVPAGANVRDLVLPNAVRIRPTFVAHSESPKWPRTTLVARLKGRDGGSTQSVRGTDGFEYFLGVAAGDYVLQCWPHPIAGAPPQGIAIAVPASDEREIDIVVEQR